MENVLILFEKKNLHIYILLNMYVVFRWHLDKHGKDVWEDTEVKGNTVECTRISENWNRLFVANKYHFHLICIYIHIYYWRSILKKSWMQECSGQYCRNDKSQQRVTGQFAQGQFARGQFAQKFEFFFLNTNLT